MDRVRRSQSGTRASQLRRQVLSSERMLGAEEEKHAKRRSRRPCKTSESDSSDVEISLRKCQRLDGRVVAVPIPEIKGAERHACGKNDLSGEVGAGGMHSALMQDRSGI